MSAVAGGEFIMRIITSFAALLLAVLCAGAALGQAYPVKPVTVIVPYVAGGATDIIARLTAQGLWEELGQSFIVENRGGGGGMIGVEGAARAVPDGYTLLFSSTGPATISPLLFKNRDFDPVARLEPIALVASNPSVLVVRNGLPARNVDELIALSKKSPGTLNMASSGNGSIQHLIGEYFQSRTGVKWQHVPFRGSAPALAEIIAERLDVMVDVVPGVAQFVQDRKMRPLAVLVEKRAPQIPDVPTLAELGYMDFDLSGWHALFAPKGAPAEAVAKLNAAINKFLKKPEYQARLVGMGAVVEGGASDRLATRVRQELHDWAEVIRNANVTATAD
jgi:tripartite-type tricarboxylate transporter receptor subunit TctC